MIFAFAQVPDLNLTTALVIYGPMGVFCGFFMWQFPKMIVEIRSLGHRIDGMTRAMLADIITRDGVGHNAQRVAQEMLAKIEANDK